jgi:DNA polymerase-1
MTTILLIDGDIVAHRAAFGAEQTHQFAEDQWVTHANEGMARGAAEKIIDTLREAVKADEIIVALTDYDMPNFRKAIYADYKKPRSKVRKPVLLKPIRAWLAENYKSYIRPTLEADDVLGILATWEKLHGKKVIASIDKDLLQIPGRHIDIDSGAKRIVSERDADYQHMLQTLTGDTVDNYPGCPGIGKKRAETILFGVFPPRGTAPEAWTAIVKAYEQKGQTEADALTQARVARILRATDYDFRSKSVRLWTPPSP